MRDQRPYRKAILIRCCRKSYHDNAHTYMLHVAHPGFCWTRFLSYIMCEPCAGRSPILSFSLAWHAWPYPLLSLPPIVSRVGRSNVQAQAPAAASESASSSSRSGKNSVCARRVHVRTAYRLCVRVCVRAHMCCPLIPFPRALS